MQGTLAAQETRVPYRRVVPGAVAAAVGAGLVWLAVVMLTNRHLSAVSMVVGMAVAHAVVWAARERRGIALQAISVTVTLVALMVVEAFAVRLLVVRELIDLGIEAELALFLPLSVSWNLVAAGITNDPPTVLFWGLALWYAITLPGRRSFFG